MEKIYTGKEKKLHYILAKRLIKNRQINADDIATIAFDCNMPTDKMPLWTFEVAIHGAKGPLCEEKLYLKDCTNYDFPTA